MDQSVGTDLPVAPEPLCESTVLAHPRPLADLGAKAILLRVIEGETVMQIATDLGVSDVAVYRFLLRNAPEQWMEVSAGKALSRLGRAEVDLDGADNKVAVSRAAASARLAQWDLERANRKLYGESKSDAVGTTINVLIQRDGYATVVEGQ